MKLEEIARRTIEIIKEYGEEGVTTAVLAKMLNVPKRRIYDVKAIMKAADLIRTSRNKDGTKIFWKGLQASGNGKSKINASKIKISTSGFITNVSNKGTEVIIEGTKPHMDIETLS